MGENDLENLGLADFYASDGRDVFSKVTPFFSFIKDLKQNESYHFRRPLTTACANKVFVRDEFSGLPLEMVMMASNNYLGLSTRPEVLEGSVAALRKYGTGMCGAPLLNGTYDLLMELERRLAELCRREECIVFPTGYSANVATISGLTRPKDVVIVDRQSHASILDGCFLSGAVMKTFRHNDVDHLEFVLKKCGGVSGGKLIAVDGVFSMDGDVAKLPDIVRLARDAGARLLVDEAHGVGVLGATGAGAVEHFGLQSEVDIVTGTFSKSLSSVGGFAAVSREAANYIRHYARPYFFSASPAPSVVGTVHAALDVMAAEPGLRERLWDNVRYFHAGLKAGGYRLCCDPPESGIISITVGTIRDVRRLNRHISRAGLFLNSVEYPAVPKNGSKLRMGVMASHTKSDIDTALRVLSASAHECGLVLQKEAERIRPG